MGGDDPTPAPAPPAEPGFLTTEFWATQLAAAATLAMTMSADFGAFSFNATQKADVTAAVAIAIMIGEGIYAVARSIRKKGTPAN